MLARFYFSIPFRLRALKEGKAVSWSSSQDWYMEKNEKEEAKEANDTADSSKNARNDGC
jgi:hypothetical protein